MNHQQTLIKGQIFTIYLGTLMGLDQWRFDSRRKCEIDWTETIKNLETSISSMDWFQRNKMADSLGLDPKKMLQLQAWPETMTSENGFDLGHQPLELVYRRLHLVNIPNGCSCKQILRCLYYWKSKPSVNKADEYFLEWTMASNILPLSIFQAAFRPGKLHTQLSLQGE